MSVGHIHRLISLYCCPKSQKKTDVDSKQWGIPRLETNSVFPSNFPRLFWLVVSNMNFIFHFIYGMSSFPVTNSIIFQDGHIAPPTRYIYIYIHIIIPSYTHHLTTIIGIITTIIMVVIAPPTRKYYY